MGREDRARAKDMLTDIVPNVRFLGGSFWTAWLLVLYGCEIEFAGIGLSSERVAELYIITSLAFGAGSAAIGAFHRRLHPLMCNFTFVSGMGMLASVGTVLVFVLEPWGAPLNALGPIFSGVGISFVAARVVLQLAELGPREALVVVAIGQIIGYAANYTVLSVMAPARPWLFFSLPLFAALVTFLEKDDDLSEMPDDSWRAPQWFWRFVLGAFFFAVPVSICRVCFPLFSGGEAMLIEFRRLTGILSIACLIGVIAFAVRLPKTASFGKIGYRFFLAISVLCVVISALGPQSGVVMGISGTMYGLLNLFVLVLLARIAFRSGASTLRVFGFGYGAFVIGGAVGWFVGAAARFFALELDAVMGILIASTVMVLFVAMFVFRQDDIESMMLPERAVELMRDDSISGHEDKSKEAFADADSTVAFEERRIAGRDVWRRKCMAAAEESGLSPRELDVFIQLAKGVTAHGISDNLCISYNTVRNHIQKIYAKCGVHSREEIQAFVRDFDIGE